MTTDIVEINNFIVLIEQSNAQKDIVQRCAIDGDAVGFAFLGTDKNERLTNEDKSKLFLAKEIMEQHICSPPSLSELSKLIGLNNNKLKKNFKELFGVPVFKFLQEERLNKAYEMLSTSSEGVQDVAWHVGYDSLSSFSNAFQSKFGVRPNEIKQQFLSNKS
ncbi:helix-turn-helix transcriptional regulator [Sphingobacterium olei]|uniref:Helix-turn-helix transcriptional regulator n=1 Tax=Sphingobacterium olei TaxID=2571155 RepID=A0A4U0P2F5_9SPHI|nr:AraC family transcriptional regulator [Sphingobacterium olei]TJZ61481.1 helix-turn-helix transcriptional regulator [Sphingobacterium olei]